MQAIRFVLWFSIALAIASGRRAGDKANEEKTGLQVGTKALGFNFLSTHVNFTDPEMAYYNPAQVLDFCIGNLTPKIVMHHRYERVDVAVFAYR